MELCGVTSLSGEFFICVSRFFKKSLKTGECLRLNVGCGTRLWPRCVVDVEVATAATQLHPAEGHLQQNQRTR